MQESKGPIGKLNKNIKSVNIIGAGVSGLVMAYYMKKNGYEVNIYEKSSVPGGKIQTNHTEYGPIEKAANAIYTNEDVIELMEELNLEYLPASFNLKKLIWRNGKARSPFSFFILFRILWGLTRKINKKNIEEQTIYEFFSPLLGEDFTRETLSAALGGVYSIPTTQIHLKSLFKEPIQAKTYFGLFLDIIKMKKGKRAQRRSEKKISKSISFKDGMEVFIKRLSSEFTDRIHFNYMGELNHSNTIICTDAESAAEILLHYPHISQLLKGIEYNKLCTSTLITKQKIPYLENAFGIVIPPSEQMKTLGVLNNSAIFQRENFHKESNSYTFISKIKKEDESTESIIKEELNQLTTLEDSDIIYYEEKKWIRAIPKYNVKRYRYIKEIRSHFYEVPNGTVLFGNYIDGISIREIISQSKKFALEQR